MLCKHIHVHICIKGILTTVHVVRCEGSRRFSGDSEEVVSILPITPARNSSLRQKLLCSFLVLWWRFYHAIFGHMYIIYTYKYIYVYAYMAYIYIYMQEFGPGPVSPGGGTVSSFRLAGRFVPLINCSCPIRYPWPHSPLDNCPSESEPAS